MRSIPKLKWLLCTIVLLSICIAFLYTPMLPPKLMDVYRNYAKIQQHDDVTQEPLKQHNNTTQDSKTLTKILAPVIEWKPWGNDSMYGDGTCPNHNRGRLIELLQRWIHIATEHNITYMLTYGSLLGAWRTGDKIPWDTDLDIYTDASDNIKLDAIQDFRNFSSHSFDFHLALDVDWRILPVGKRRRVTCDGKTLNQYYKRTDSCTFTGPVGRLIKGYEKYLDIWDVERVNGLVFDRYGKGYYYPEDEIFPLKKCTYMGLEVYCPRNPKPIFDAFYGRDANLTNKRICKEGTWIDTTKNENMLII